MRPISSSAFAYLFPHLSQSEGERTVSSRKNLSFTILMLTVLVQLLLSNKLFSQSNAAHLLSKENVIHLVTEELDSSLSMFIKTEFLDSEQWGLNSVLPFSELSVLFEQLQETSSYRGQIAVQSTYLDGFTGDSISRLEPQNFTLFELNTSISVAKLPLNIGGRGIITNGSFDENLSRFQIQFDWRQYLRKFESGYESGFDALQAGLSGVEPSTELLTTPEVAMLQNELKFQVYQMIISHPKFVDMLVAKDSLIQERKDINNLAEQPQVLINSKREKAKEVVQIYRQLWKDRSSYYGKPLDSLKTKIENITTDFQAQQRLDSIKQNIQEDPTISKFRKLLASTKHFSIGQTILDESWYTVSSLPINGVHYAYEGNKGYGSVAYGKQFFNTHFYPWLNSTIRNAPGGNVFFFKYGIKSDENNWLQYSYLNHQESARAIEGIVLPSRRNQIFSLSGKVALLEQISLKSEIAFSRNATPADNLVGTVNDLRRSTAGEIQLESHFFNNGLNAGIGYYYVGPEYISTTNPFLQTNREGFILDVKGNLKNKLFIDATVRLGKSIDDIGAVQQKEVQVLGNLTWEVDERFSISGHVSPNTFQQLGTGIANFSASNWLYNFQANYQVALGKTNLVNSGGLTNYNGRIINLDSSQVNSAVNVFSQHSMMFPNQHIFTVIGMVGWNSTPSLEMDQQNEEDNSIFIQAQYQIPSKKYSVSLGGQLVKDAFDPDFYYGIINSFNFHISSSFELVGDFNLQLPCNKKEINQKRFLLANLRLSKLF